MTIPPLGRSIREPSARFALGESDTMGTPAAPDELDGPSSGVPSPSARRPRRRSALGRIFEVAILAGLACLTYANATDSRPLREASDAEGRGDYPTALRAATEHLDRRPWSREASRIVARCLSRLDFAEKAEPYYQRGGALSLADLRYRAYGLTRANLRDRAVRAFDDVLARQGDDVASLRLKAGLLMASSRWGEVAEVGRRLSALPRRPVAVETPISVGEHWTFRPREVESVPTIGATLEAIAAHNEGEPELSVPAYERVLALDPGLRSMPLDRRLFWSQFGDDLLAIGRAADVIRLLGGEEEGRSDPGLVALQARAHSSLGAVDEAEACWRRVLELAPDVASAWVNLGRIESGRGNDREAARLLARGAELAPDSVDAAFNLGLTYRKLGSPDKAREWEQEAARRRLRRDEKTRGHP